MPSIDRPDVPLVRLSVFGTLELRGDANGEIQLLELDRAISVLIYLATAQPFGFHRRDRVVGLFWPEQRQEHARAALRKTMHLIRNALGKDALLSMGDENVAVNRDLVWCDAYELVQAQERDALARALELYRGPFLDGFVADAPEFERWAAIERTRYRDMAVEMSWTLAERYEQGEDLTSAARWARKAARLASGADERVLRRALKLLHRAGDRAGAVQIYEVFLADLKRDYDVEPSAETLALMREIRGTK